MRAPLRLRYAILAAIAFLSLVALPDPRPEGHGAGARASMGALQRTLGPIASIASSVEWVRYRLVLDGGDPARAYGHARRAIELDPRAHEGWFELGQHFVFTRGSFLEDPDPAARRRWIQAGLDVLREGEARAAAPGELAHLSGMIRFAYLAGLPQEDLLWPGGREALLEAALDDFRRAERFGREDAAEAVRSVQAELEH